MKTLRFSFKTESLWLLAIFSLMPLLAMLLALVVPAFVRWLRGE
ncbi:MAG TPA: hypothetical protein VLM38_20690 [Blastocatellia bacterium]|nr:hypothetical protein [Blastocatellia bacterium]